MILFFSSKNNIPKSNISKNREVNLFKTSLIFKIFFFFSLNKKEKEKRLIKMFKKTKNKKQKSNKKSLSLS
jgi:hypothetical protein